MASSSALPDSARVLLDRSRVDVGKVLRLTGAATVSYVVAVLLLDAPVPILAPLTALLVVQVTLVGIVRSGVDRVLAVIAGVLVATAFSRAVGISWWSLGLLIGAALVVGQLLRLGDNLLEVPISAMIVLGAGAVEATAQDRVVETLIGAVCGLGVNLLVPPRIRVVGAAGAVRDLAAEMAEVVERAAEDVVDGLSLEEAARLVEGTVRIGEQVGLVDRTLVEAEDSRRLNPRAIGTTTTSGPQLRSALDVLEHTAVALRGLARTIADAVAAREQHPDDGVGYSPEAREALGQLLRELGAALRAFGGLVHAEVEGDVGPQEDELATMLEALREARVRLTELLLVDPRGATSASWELNGAILTSVERVMRELDTEERARLRTRLAEEPPRSSTAVAVDRLRHATVEASRQVADAAEAVVDAVVEVPRRQVRKVRRARRSPDG